MIPNYAAVKIAIERPDGGVSIMSFMTVGRGNILPSGAVWLNQDAGSWSREPTDSAVAGEVAKSVPDFLSWHRLTDDEVPTDRTFRDALTISAGKFECNIAKAREITRDNLRHQRAAAMPDLDAKWMRATGQGKKADAIEAQRQQWRDAPADPLIDAASTTEELARIVNGG